MRSKLCSTSKNLNKSSKINIFIKKHNIFQFIFSSDYYIYFLDDLICILKKKRCVWPNIQLKFNWLENLLPSFRDREPGAVPGFWDCPKKCRLSTQTPWGFFLNLRDPKGWDSPRISGTLATAHGKFRGCGTNPRT